MNTKNISNYYKKFTIAKNNPFNFQASNVALPKSESLKKITDNKTAVLISVIVLLFAAFMLGRILPGGNGGQISAPKAAATQALNKEFKFPLRDDAGKKVSDISYVIQSANLQDSFIYQGKVAEAVKGRTFLIFNLKITNPYGKSIQINARDYLRVRVNGTNEQLAPEIHNDPVQIDANATKYTRVGLPLNSTDKDIEMLVGEISGPKETIKLSLER
jgi:hypothetical protein